MMKELPEYEETEIKVIPETVRKLKTTFDTQKTRPVAFRLVQLRKLYWGLEDHADQIVEACKRDLGKCSFETYLTEIHWCQNDILFTCKNLEKWALEEKAPDIALFNSLFRPRIRKDPLGCVLILGAYNLPVQLSLGPTIGAIAAGCTVVLKPSEQAPSIAAVIETVCRECLDGSCYTVVQGGRDVSRALLDEKWDKIFFTGSPKTGRIVAEAAARNLTPVTLELGGLNPAIVTKHADPKLAARRLLWGKVHNSGQICTSNNYTLVDKEILPFFIAELKTALQEFFPNGALSSPDYGRIVSDREFRRLKSLLDGTTGTIVIGGSTDASCRFFEPTVVQVDSPSDPLITNESFGPLLPLLPVSSVDEAIRIAKAVHDSPLAVFPFGTKTETNHILDCLRSGGATVNDSYFHAAIQTLPFGGVGESGQGAYRGRQSFETFVHRRSVATTPSWAEKLLAIRYPPYSDAKLKGYRIASVGKPDFDRDGNVRTGLAKYLALLGTKGRILRILGIILFILVIKKHVERVIFHGWPERWKS